MRGDRISPGLGVDRVQGDGEGAEEVVDHQPTPRGGSNVVDVAQDQFVGGIPGSQR
jgi:hypothetical protein